MPALEILGRRWHIAADDLPLPSLMGALWHIAILVLNCVDLAFVVYQLDTSCPYRRRHLGYLSIHLLCFLINSILHAWTFFESFRGSMFQVHRRRRVGPLVLAVVVFYCFTLASNLFGTQLVDQYRSTQQCVALPGRLSFNHYALMEFIVVATWVSIFIACLAVVVTLSFFSTYQAASSPWLSRFKLCSVMCFCCFWKPCRWKGESEEGAEGGANDSSSADRYMSPTVVIANVFTHMFGRVDMTLTDYTAAFMLLGVRHSHSKPALRYANAPPPEWLVTCGSAAGSADWRQRPDGIVEAVLQPPPVVEIAASSRGSGAIACSTVPAVAVAKARVVAAEHVALQLDLESPPANPSHSTAVSMDGMDGAVGPVAAHHTAAAVLGSPARAPGSAATKRVKDGAPGIQQAAATIAYDGAASQVVETGSAAPGGIQSPVCGRDDMTKCNGSGSCDGGRGGLLQRWDSDDFAAPNASYEVMEEAAHYMRFATAVYGWKMYLWMNRTRVTGCCRLCVGRGCGCCRQSTYFIRSVGTDYGPSEGCCSAYKLLEREAITQLTEVKDDDILYVCYENQVGGLLPYYIALDRPRCSLVVAVRGSLSLSDVITDLLCEPAEYDVPGVPSTDTSGRRVMWAHRGMLQSTRAILRDLQQQGVLEAATAEWPQHDGEAQQRLLERLPSERAQAVAQRLRGAASHFRVVLTGHSLGAGITGLLGPLLRPQFPNLRCWAYAPPGGLMSPKAAELTHDMCISLLYAKDMIPRLGVSTTEQLVQELVDVGVHSRLNKATIMGRLVLLGERPPLERLLLPPGTPLKAELQAVLSEVHFEDSSEVEQQHQQHEQQRRDAKEGTKESDRCRNCHLRVAEQFAGARDFVPPGHMLYVERRRRLDALPPSAWRCSCNVCLLDRNALDADYVCRWIQVKDLMQTGLVISRSMFLDHLPDNTLYGMMTALQQMRESRSGHVAAQQPAADPANRGEEAAGNGHGHRKPHEQPVEQTAASAEVEVAEVPV